MKPIKKENLPLVNEKITAPRVQLILNDGSNLGVVPRMEAQHQAAIAGLDLVMIADRGSEGFPVVKVMDFGKELYDKKKKAGEAKKHQKVIQVKELKIRPKIGAGDFATKMKQAYQFLRDGKRVKVTLWFRGRENAMKDEHSARLFGMVEQAFDSEGFTKDLVQEKDTKMGQTWSRIYYLKSGK
ncbi:MAG TPA: translation initiation factor IF-3 [Candidatus Babeliales bacterium]|nr:translation initiation factor IF-3 [Candidatus Babeliales bacterium]